MYRSEVSEFKGNKTLSIYLNDKYVIGFGLTKAKAILNMIDQIKAFVEQFDNNNSSDNVSINMSKLSPEARQAILKYIK